MINVASGRTSGPWRFDGNRRFIEAEVDGQFVKVLIAAHGCSGDTWVEVSDANAHLIAAAPELYEIAERVSRGECTCEDLGGEGFICDVCEAKAALARARGEK